MPAFSINDVGSSFDLAAIQMVTGSVFSRSCCFSGSAKQECPDGRDFCLGTRSGLMHSPALSCTLKVS